MAKKYTGSLTLEWFNKNRSIITQKAEQKRENDIPAPRINWINKDEALFYEISEEEGKGLTPYWVDRNDIRVKESRPLVFQKAYKAIPDGEGFKVEESDEDDPEIKNILIKGDNLLALNTLKKHFSNLPESEKPNCIYIDPPYNIGVAFEQYDDNLEHSEWLSLTRDRLLILRDILAEDGSLWVSIDDKEMAYMKILLDEIFGRDSFIACNVWQKRYSRENREAIGDVHEYILVYAKDAKVFKLLRNLVPPTEDQVKVYRNPNNDPKGRWRPIPLTAQAGHATKEQFYEIVTPSGKVYTPPEGRCWGISKSTFAKLNKDGRIYYGKNNDSQPNLIRYLSEVEGFAPWTWWPSSEVGHTDEAKKEMHAIFGKNKAFETPKPERLIERIFHIATREGDLILDCFGGSGTTYAVAHKMKRKWFGVEIGDHADTHIISRLKTVIDASIKIGINESTNWKGGGSFKYYHLGESIISIDKEGYGDFNWTLGRDFIEKSLLTTYDFILDDNFESPGSTIEQTPKIGFYNVNNYTMAGIVSLSSPDEALWALDNEYINELIRAIRKYKSPQSITIFTNRGVEMAWESKPEDVEIIKVPHAIFAELER